ncbi:IS5/IS1182 family transposase [Nostoc piscinale]|uniref:IS5/IS1182 family transposase n=1 Tax=Nostoc piscinale TaxID=224012 RepID=UPI0007839066
MHFERSQLCLADQGYQGITKLYTLSCIPCKKPRGANLPTSQRQHNRLLARLGVVGEHINRSLKIFRILKEKYRNRRKRFGLRCNLIAGLLNYELALFS